MSVNTKAFLKRFKMIHFVFLLLAAIDFGFMCCSKGFNSSDLKYDFKEQDKVSTDRLNFFLPLFPSSIKSQNPNLEMNKIVTFSNGATAATGEKQIILKVQAKNPRDKIVGVDLFVMGIKESSLASAPFEYNLNLIGKRGPLLIEAMVLFANKSKALASMDLYLNYSGGSGQIANDCLTNPAFDSCLFWKNPVAQEQISIFPLISFGANIDKLQKYGVHLTNQVQPDRLKSETIDVYASGGSLARPTSEGNWKHLYKNDSGKSYVAQLVAYYWITELENIIKSTAGGFYATGKNVPVDAYSDSNSRRIANNANFNVDVHHGRVSNPHLVVGSLRIRGDDDDTRSEVALGAEILIHEMGHANMVYASPEAWIASRDTQRTIEKDELNYVVCRNETGCIGAIHEGQADFHVGIVFSQNPRIGEQALNYSLGMEYRDPSNPAARKATAKAIFEDPNQVVHGEIHRMGALYSVILWELYNSPEIIRNEFIQIFQLHLTMLAPSSTFIDSREALIAVNNAYFKGKYTSPIRMAFARHGLE